MSSTSPEPNRHELAFQRGVDEVTAFSAARGHARPSYDFVTDDGFPLGRWVDTRRNERRNGTLASDRIEALERVPGWSWQALDDKFARGLAAVFEYVAETGNSDIPVGYRVGDFRLGEWVGSRRREYRRGALPADRVDSLEAVPGWWWSFREKKYLEGFAHLRAYVAEYGHAGVPYEWVDDDGYLLGVWAGRRRTEKRQGKISDRRTRELEQLPGWKW
jgi:hypothetical protein